jgi:hypothetical protein
MANTTITVKTDTRDKLAALKMDGQFKNLDALIGELLIEYRRKKLQETSLLMRRKMKEKGLTLKDLIE